MKTFWDTLRDLVWDTRSKHRQEQVSKHRSGRYVTEAQASDRKARRRARNRAASAMRAIQRRRDKGSAKRQR